MTKDKEKWKIIAKFSQKDFSNFSSFFWAKIYSTFRFLFLLFLQPVASVLVTTDSCVDFGLSQLLVLSCQSGVESKYLSNYELITILILNLMI